MTIKFDIETEGLFSNKSQSNKTSFIKLLPIANSKKSDYNLVLEDLGKFLKDENLETTQKGLDLAFDTIKNIKDNGLPKMAKTRFENLGGTVFPVTYFENGIVVIDYPNKLICDIVKDKNNL